MLEVTPDNLTQAGKDLRGLIRFDNPFGAALHEVLKDADVFIGLSRGNILTPAHLQVMAADRIVFAMANPDPEIAPDQALPHCRIMPRAARIIPIRSIICWPFPASSAAPRCAGARPSMSDEVGRRFTLSPTLSRRII